MRVWTGSCHGVAMIETHNFPIFRKHESSWACYLPLFPSVIWGPLWLSQAVSGGRCTCAQLLSHGLCSVTPGAIARQAPLSKRFSRQKYWGGLPFPSPHMNGISAKMKNNHRLKGNEGCVKVCVFVCVCVCAMRKRGPRRDSLSAVICGNLSISGQLAQTVSSGLGQKSLFAVTKLMGGTLKWVGLSWIDVWCAIFPEINFPLRILGGN